MPQNEALKLDLDKLESDALKATQGEWEDFGNGEIMAGKKAVMEIDYSYGFGGTLATVKISPEDWLHVINCSPQNILALIARVRELESLENLRDELHAQAESLRAGGGGQGSGADMETRINNLAADTIDDALFDAALKAAPKRET